MAINAVSITSMPYFMKRILFLFVVFFPTPFALRWEDGSYPLVPEYADNYYYKHLNEKMNESMSINNCSLYGSSILIPHGGAVSRADSDLSVEIVPPTIDVINRWQDQNNGKFKMKLFAQGNYQLCSSTDFRGFKKGFFKRSKGCYKMNVINKKGEKIRRINTYGATLHVDHIRCDVETGGSLCGTPVAQGRTTEIVSLPAKLRLLNSYPFVIRAKHVIVAKSGMLALPCGPFGLFSSCEAVNWGVSTAAAVVDRVYDCQRYYGAPAEYLNRSTKFIHSDSTAQPYCPFRRVKRVFLMSQYDDTQIGQFMMESFPRLVYHYDFLKSNPDVYIHFGFTKQEILPNFTLPNIFINWLGFGDRLINGTFYADEVIMSREGGCQDAGYNAWEVVSMRDRFINQLGLPTDNELFVSTPGKSVPSNIKPSIVILVRSSGSRYVQNKGYQRLRGWPVGFVESLTVLFRTQFPSHEVKIFSDMNSTLMRSPPEQIALFRTADIAIGYHGAGLSNTMYMKPGGIVVEVLSRFDSRHAPGVGIFPRLSGIIGLHHLTYFIKDLNFTPEALAEDTSKFYQKVKLWSDH